MVYDLLRLRVEVYGVDPRGRDAFFHDRSGPFVTLQGDFSANVIGCAREVEECVAKLKELECEWEEEAPSSENYVEELGEFMRRKLKKWHLQKANDSVIS